MTKLEEIHLDIHDYRDAAAITEQIAIEFAEWLNKSNYFRDDDIGWCEWVDTGDGDTVIPIDESTQELFQKFIETR